MTLTARCSAPPSSRALASLALVLSLAACAVGPRFDDDPALSPESTPGDATASAPTDARAPAREAGSAGPDAGAAPAADAAPTPLADATSDATSSPTPTAPTPTPPDAAPTPTPTAPDAAPTPTTPSASELVLSEIQFNPSSSEPDGEWVEIANVASGPRSLRGLALRDGGGRSKVIDQDVVIAPGGFVVLARSRVAARAQGVPDAVIGYEYGAGLSTSAGILLANGATGSIALMAGTTELARVPYGTFSLGDSPGKSVQRRVLAGTSVGTAAQFCVSRAAYGATGHMGTPGAPPDCP